MKLTTDEINELRKKLGQYFLDYSIRHTKNVAMRYVNMPGPVPMIAQANEMPYVDEFIGILLKEPEY
jgi:hypothetical protein